MSFLATSEGIAGARSFARFSAAAEEAGRSRIYGGIHFEFDNQAGLAAGRALAGSLYAEFLTPVPEPGSLMLLGLGLVGLAGYGWRHRRSVAGRRDLPLDLADLPWNLKATVAF